MSGIFTVLLIIIFVSRINWNHLLHGYDSFEINGALCFDALKMTEDRISVYYATPAWCVCLLFTFSSLLP